MNYVTVGTNEITEEKFRPIEDRIDDVKPIGGLWLTENKAPYYNDWVDFILCNQHLLFYKYCHDKMLWELPCSLVTIKEDSKIFQLNQPKNLDYLLNNYPYNDFISFQKLSEDYDGILIKLLYVWDMNTSKKAIENINKFAVDTLLLFNPKCIDYYQKGIVKLIDINIKEPIYELKYESEKRKVLKR